MLQNQSTQMGIPMAVAGQELRLALNGSPISRLSKDNRNYDVSLQFRKEDRSAPQSWKQVPIRAQNGMVTTLGSVATQIEGEAPLQINVRTSLECSQFYRVIWHCTRRCCSGRTNAGKRLYQRVTWRSVVRSRSA